jgi:hypothetical protein
MKQWQFCTRLEMLHLAINVVDVVELKVVKPVPAASKLSK